MSGFGFGEQLERGRDAEAYNAWIADRFRPFVGQRVLEVGCGIGNMLTYWTDRALVLGVDSEAECIAKSRERFRDKPNVRLLNDSAGAPGWIERWSTERPDTIMAVNVLEHIREDLEALRGWRQILEAGGGGHVCVYVPAFEFAYSSFDRRFGHFRRYTKETLRDKLLDAGFVLEELRYFNLPGLIAWWTTFVLLKKEIATTKEVALYSKLVIPFARRLESFVAPPFGNSVIAVGRVDRR